MVARKDLKFGLALPFLLLVPATLGVLAFLLLPVGQGNPLASLAEVVAVLVLAGTLLVVVALALTSIDVLQSKKLSTKGKMAWLVTLWIAPGSIFAAIYYFFREKKGFEKWRKES